MAHILTVRDMIPLPGAGGDPEWLQAVAAAAAAVPPAGGPRRVDLVVSLTAHDTTPSLTHVWAAVAGALVACGRLVNGDRRHCVQGRVQMEMGERGLVITLTDLAAVPSGGN